MNPKILALICAILIAILEGLALWKGMDGTTLALAIGGIAGLGGYSISKIYSIIKGNIKK